MTRRVRILKDVLWTLAIWGAVAGLLRFAFGLGATTNLSDSMPWGLWKIFNMLAGAAVSTSGFMLGILVYVLRRAEFKPLVRPAILIAALGYGSSLFALLFDIGLPHLFWHPVYMWNLHSFLFEVFWCVSLYFSIAALESLPIVLQGRAERVSHIVHRAVFGLVVVGATLSTLHHSSLGSLFLLTPERLHPLWSSPLIPALFLISAIGGGLMFLIFVRLAYAWLYDPAFSFDASPASASRAAQYGPSGSPCPDLAILSTLSVIAAGFLAAYLGLKVFDLGRAGAWTSLISGGWDSALYLTDLGLTAIVPLVVVAIPAARRSAIGLMAAGLAGTLGLALNRMNVGVFGFFPDAGAAYVPSLIEWSLSVGIIAGAAIVYLFVAENSGLFTGITASPQGGFRASLESFTHVWRRMAEPAGARRVSFIAAIMLPVAFASMGLSMNASTGSDIIEAPTGLDATRSVLVIDGDRRGMSTTFAHAEHQRRLGGKESCATCHHIGMPGDQATSCARCHRLMNAEADVFDHTRHWQKVAAKERLGGMVPANNSCVFCHAAASPKTADTAKPCLECHRKDMPIVAAWPYAKHSVPDLQHPVGYREAMHEMCITCHRARQASLGKTGMDECAHCHRRTPAAPASVPGV